jgi:hypothetical protein
MNPGALLRQGTLPRSKNPRNGSERYIMLSQGSMDVYSLYPSINRCSNRRLACMLEEVILKWQIQQT